MSDLKDVRDVRACHLLGYLLMQMGRGRFSQAADVIAMRVREIRMAKKDGGSWEKASVCSLLPGTHPGTAVVPDGAMII